jgi:hypothetical protein
MLTRPKTDSSICWQLELIVQHVDSDGSSPAKIPRKPHVLSCVYI